jgi:hypothetical protein
MKVGVFGAWERWPILDLSLLKIIIRKSPK